MLDIINLIYYFIIMATLIINNIDMPFYIIILNSTIAILTTYILFIYNLFNNDDHIYYLTLCLILMHKLFMYCQIHLHCYLC